jgi:hypothetical protein
MLISGQSFSETIQDRIGHAQYDLHQMWALSNNYYYGTTVKKDRVKALTWHLIYVSVLPKSYPGLKSLLQLYKKDLSDEDIDVAKTAARDLKNKYHLNFTLSEKELYSAFHVDNKQFKVSPNELSPIKNLKNFLEEVNHSQPALAIKYNKLIDENKENEAGVLIYGQVIVNGVPRARTVSVNASLNIDENGYFMSIVQSSPVLFQLSGYADIKKTFSTEDRQVNLSRILLNPIPENKRASVVGMISPQKNIDNMDIVLRLKNQMPREESWYNSLEQVVLLPSGQFYAKDLSPTEYELVISYEGKIIKTAFSLHQGAVKKLSKITM